MDAVLLPALQQCIVLLPLCLGVYLTYCIMQITDLTVEGTFVLGAGIFSRMVVHGHHHALAFMIAVTAASCVGLLVAVIQRVAKLDALITSILAVFMLYSINFKAMGRPNISLLSQTTLMQQLMDASLSHMLMGLLAIGVVSVVAIYLLLKSRFGLLLRAYGDNDQLLVQLAKNKFVILVVGLMISNGLAAVSGILSAQLNGYADVKMGLGVALTAIGSIILGLNLSKQFCKSDSCYRAFYELLSCFVGVLIYFLVMNILLYAGIDPMYMKLALGVLLMFFLSSHHLSKKRSNYA